QRNIDRRERQREDATRPTGRSGGATQPGDDVFDAARILADRLRREIIDRGAQAAAQAAAPQGHANAPEPGVGAQPRDHDRARAAVSPRYFGEWVTLGDVEGGGLVAGDLHAKSSRRGRYCPAAPRPTPGSESRVVIKILHGVKPADI